MSNLQLVWETQTRKVFYEADSNSAYLYAERVDHFGNKFLEYMLKVNFHPSAACSNQFADNLLLELLGALAKGDIKRVSDNDTKESGATKPGT